MALNPAKDDPNYDAEAIRKLDEPEKFGDFRLKEARDAEELRRAKVAKPEGEGDVGKKK